MLAGFSTELGLELPLPLQVTSSFVIPLSASVHGKVNSTQAKLLKQVERQGSILPVAEALGYRMMLWGPVEESIWHPRVKERFIETRKETDGWGKSALSMHLVDGCVGRSQAGPNAR